MPAVSSEIIIDSSEMNKYVEMDYDEWDIHGLKERQYYEPDVVDAVKEYIRLETSNDRSHFLEQCEERTKMILSVTLLVLYSLI